MGGRGASSGTSVYGNKYGSQYRTIAKEGNIKIVEPKVDNPETLVETMTKGRVYGLINSKGNLGSILYFDNENKRTKRIDLDHSHNGIQPHTQHGYLKSTDTSNKGASRLTTEVKKMVARVQNLWENNKSRN